MKKLTTLVAIPALLLAACGTSEDQQETDSTEETTESAEEATEVSEKVTLDVASLIPPMTEILELVEPELAEEGIDLNVVVLGDNIQPNDALHHEEVDANFFQHVPFMEEYNINNDASLVPVEPIYFANYGVYAADYESMDELPEGATIAIANDISNIDRSLQLLAQHDVIELEETDERYYTQSHISENPNDYNFEEVDLLMLARMYDDADAVVITPAYAEPLGLTPANDALLTEGTENEFAITLVAREDNVDEEAIQTLAEVMTSDIVRDFLEENYDETAIPAFDHE
ncbi:MetQ/NlpA family ABC transporter substrate-binding protein [Geomicrobium sp. JCM 19055]|uniref:MetQ/NlpA family ABC transporter substrate-binding protein n=1 Tax=Geomicrobium sp. JCM 19055 TaxID=1460649 RepID=UPI00045EDC84|nr:MetQ/NlpA family ABC transporter substrate-binding protein [Geomicrobium sp. JCM 19055]GAK01128.1 methionine ABC transporter substrate-binding protein [Geomicrobium sp. JCM 19055]